MDDDVIMKQSLSSKLVYPVVRKPLRFEGTIADERLTNDVLQCTNRRARFIEKSQVMGIESVDYSEKRGGCGRFHHLL